MTKPIILDQLNPDDPEMRAAAALFKQQAVLATTPSLQTTVQLTPEQDSRIAEMVAGSIATLPRRTLSRVMTAADANELIGARVPVLAATAELSNGGLWTDADTGQPVLAIFPCLELPALRAAVLSAQPAFGANTPRLQMGFSNLSVTFGYRPKKPLLGQEGCVLTAFNRDYPDAATFLGYYSEVLAQQVAAAFPEIEVMGQAAIDKVLPDWRLSKSSLWTSGVINKESALPYHRDRNNFDAWSVMPVIRKGVKGGFLHIPEYGIAVPARDGWAVAFYGKGLVHGVTPMAKTRDDAYRISVVYYALQGLKDCQPAGTMVRVPVQVPRAGRGRQFVEFKEVPIETLVAGDKVVTWGRATSELLTRGKALAGVTAKQFDGELVRVQAGEHFSRYTPKHHTILETLNTTLDDGEFVVYLMQRGAQYRVGRTAWKAGSGPVTRALQEKAENVWVLSAHHTAAEAGLAEAVAQARYGLPGISFSEDSQYAFDLAEFWAAVGGNRLQAEACLAANGRVIDRPLFRRPLKRNQRWVSPDGVAAANLMSGMLVQVPTGEFIEVPELKRREWPTRWERITVSAEAYSGLVYSLEVEKDHNYIADGIVTHNCHTYAEETARERKKRSEREDAMALRPALTAQERMQLPRANIAKDGDGIGFSKPTAGDRAAAAATATLPLAPSAPVLP
jgi:hypothetical protein